LTISKQTRYIVSGSVVFIEEYSALLISFVR